MLIFLKEKAFFYIVPYLLIFSFTCEKYINTETKCKRLYNFLVTSSSEVVFINLTSSLNVVPSCRLILPSEQTDKGDVANSFAESKSDVSVSNNCAFLFLCRNLMFCVKTIALYACFQIKYILPACIDIFQGCF